MKVELGSQNINPSLEKDMSGYNSYGNYSRKDAEKAKSVANAGFVLDIGGNNADNLAFGMSQELKSAEAMMQEVGNTNVALQKDMMTVMSNTMSKEDYAEFAKNGYSMADMSVDEQVTSLDKLKAKLAEAGTIIEGYNDDLSDEELKEITGSEGLANKIGEALKANDLPINNENVRNIVTALDKAENIKPLNDESVKYMVLNQLEPSVDNLYKAEYSSGNNAGRQRHGYYQDTNNGYFQKQADTVEWEQLKGQAEKIVKEAGFKADEATMENAKWLIEQGIPLNADSISSLNNIRGLEVPVSRENAIEPMAVGIADGRSPQAASLTNTETMVQKSLNLIRDLNEVDDEALKAVAESGEVLNIRNLREASQNLTVGEFRGDSLRTDPTGGIASASALAGNRPARFVPESGQNPTQILDNLRTDVIDVETASLQTDEFITAKRQLEETRLAMTYEANLKLLKQGISIDTEPLSELVDKLRKAEKGYFEPLLINKGESFENDDVKADALNSRIGLYKESLTVFEALRTIPAETIGRVDTEGQDFTARRVYEASEPIKVQYQKLESTYEALMTAPRSDMGDSIRKAFQNVDDILSDNGFELNENNRRAVRILGYAEMDINEASIERVREADQALRQVLEAMTPAKTLEMIRNGDNPLDENIFSLRERLGDSASAKDTERYSKFLVRLERKGEITEDEKDAFIGMYRLFRQIEKSDGKLLGNVLDSGGNLTLRNMLSASRSNRAKGMDYGIGNDFGGLEKLISKGTSISGQIDEGFRKASVNTANPDYYLNQGSELLNKLSPDTLSFENVTPETTIEELYQNVVDRFADRSVESLIDDYEDDQAELLAARQVEDNVIEVLTDSSMPVTPDNLLAQDVLMNQRGKTFNSLMKEASKEDALSERVKSAVSHMQDSFDGREEAERAYEELRDASDELISGRALELKDAVDVRELMLLNKQISVAAGHVRDESYEVPVEIDGQWTSINLKLVRDGKESGTVTATMETEGYGKIGAKFSLNGKQLSGYITGDNKEGLKKLAEKADELSKELTENDREIRQLNFIDTGSLDLNRFAVAEESGAEETADNRELYEVAKAFIKVVQR